MTPHEQFLSRRQRYQPIALPPDLSEEDLARDWTLSDDDRAEIGKYRKSFRLSLAIQLCAVRVYGRFFTPIQGNVRDTCENRSQACHRLKNNGLQAPNFRHDNSSLDG
jgi:hypothetical protein